MLGGEGEGKGCLINIPIGTPVALDRSSGATTDGGKRVLAK